MIVAHSYHWVRLVSGEIGTLLKILSTLHKVEICSFFGYHTYYVKIVAEFSPFFNKIPGLHCLSFTNPKVSKAGFT